MHKALPLHPHDVPAGYPRQFEREVRLRDGRSVLVRPIVPGDAAALADAIRTADAETLRRRFLGSPPRLTPAMIEHLSTVDYKHRFALAAIDPLTRHGVAIARYEGACGGVADVAVAVDRPWRRAGLATALIGMLAEAAVDRGIRSFNSYYLAENRPVAALLGLAGTRGKQTIQLGIAEFLVSLDRESVAAVIRDLNSTHPGAVPGAPLTAGTVSPTAPHRARPADRNDPPPAPAHRRPAGPPASARG